MGTFATSWTTGDTIPASELNTLSGAWTTYTPTVGGTGFALGNGTISGRYKKVGRIITARVFLTWGSTSTYGAGPLTLTNPATTGASGWSGSCTLYDASATTYYSGKILSNSTTFSIYGLLASGTYLQLAAVSSTVPFTWTTSDQIEFTAIYESAS